MIVWTEKKFFEKLYQKNKFSLTILFFIHILPFLLQQKNRSIISIMKTFQFLYKQKIYYFLNSTLKIDLLSKQPFHKFTFFNTFFTLYNFMQNWSNFVFYLQHYKFIKCIYFINFHSLHKRTDYLFRKENYSNLTVTITYSLIKLICAKKHVEIIFCKFLLSLL